MLDATAGLGRDAFVLASLGCQVTLIERVPAVAALLENGIERALLNVETATIAKTCNYNTARQSTKCSNMVNTILSI